MAVDTPTMTLSAILTVSLAACGEAPEPTNEAQRGCPDCVDLDSDLDSPPPYVPPAEPDPPPPQPVAESDGARMVTNITALPFSLGPGEEAFYCQNFDNPFDEPMAITSSESVMTAGSHHLIVLQGGEFSAGWLEECDGLQFGPFVHSSQTNVQTFDYPEGVGRFLAPYENLRFVMHYLNTTSEPIDATVELTLRGVTSDQIDQLASYLFINTLGIDVAPLSAGSAGSSCAIAHDIEVISANSHMHQFGVGFVSTTDDGRVVHETTEWAEPEFTQHDPPLAISAGSTVSTRCQYENTLDASLSFGESAATNEMCILNAVFFPAVDGEPITCLF